MQFGAWSTLLGVLAAQNLALGIALLLSRTNCLANRYLGLLLICVAGMMTPFVIGYAGAYDLWPWLTSAPFAVSLAIGPLLYGHIIALSQSRLITWYHFIGPIIQFAYQAVLFPFPVTTKWWWDAEIHQPYFEPAFSIAVVLSIAAYTVLCWRELAVYEAWLRARRRQTKAALRLRAAALFISVLLTARAAFDLFDLLVRKVDYFDLFTFYILLGASGLIIGMLAWRDSRLPTATMEELPERDWHQQGAVWLRRVEQAGWWREPELDLARLARLLGTNTTQLSRALNEGHGGFAEALGAMRAKAVAEALDEGSSQELLSLALASGFGSKASFNRIFRAQFGVSPSAYRHRVHGSKGKSLR